MDYRFCVSYYRGKDKKADGENEIDLIIEENGVLYPVEIKMSGNPKASMASANTVLDKVIEKKQVIKEGSEELWKFAKNLIDESVANGILKK